MSNAEALARRVLQDSDPDLNPDSSFWAGASELHFSGDFHGHPTPHHLTRLLLQWSDDSLYLLFVCPYEKLHLKPDPDQANETYQLWDWDVAEAFLGTDFENIRHYKEFEVSPQAEWVDLDVNLDEPPHETGWVWKSECKVDARIDRAAQVWYGFMRIPWRSIDDRPPAAGNRLRANFFRCQGADPDRKYIAWKAPGRPSFHTPEVFGVLRLMD